MATATRFDTTAQTPAAGAVPHRNQRIGWMVVAAAVAVGVAGFALWTRSSAPETVALSPELVRQQAMSDAELRQELIERGAIPSGTAAVSSEFSRQQAMSDAELRQELIERGLIPGGTTPTGGVTPALTNVREAP